ncbi:MAG: hypothetical protein WCG01_03485 [bacterium]
MQIDKALRIIALSLVVVISGLSGLIHLAQANTSTTLNQTINPGSLTMDFKDNSEVSTTTSVTFGALAVSATCQQTATSSLGSATQRIWIDNLNAANNGWTVSIGAATSSLWHNVASTSKYDFNDAGGAGCTDGDADTFGGQMFIDPTAATIATGSVPTTMTGVSAGAATAFTSAASNVTLIQAAAGSDDIGKWKAYGFGVSQKIPANQSSNAYSFDLTVTIVAN